REVCPPDLGGHVQRAARHAGARDGAADRILVGIHLRGVDVAVAHRERRRHRALARLALHAERAEAELGHRHALRRDHVHVSALLAYVIARRVAPWRSRTARQALVTRRWIATLRSR